MSNLLELQKIVVDLRQEIRGDINESSNEIPVLRNKNNKDDIIFDIADAVQKNVDLSQYEAVTIELSKKKDLLEAIGGKEDSKVTLDDINRAAAIYDILIEVAGEEEFQRIKRNLMQQRSNFRRNNEKEKEEQVENELVELYKLFNKIYNPRK